MSRESESLQKRLFTRTQEVAGLANALSSCYKADLESEKRRGHPYPWMNSFPKRRRVHSLREEISEALRSETNILLELMQALQERRMTSPGRRWGTVTRNLLTYIRGLEKDGVQENEYLELFRKEVLLFQQDWKRLKRIS